MSQSPTSVYLHVQTCCCEKSTRSVLCGSQESFELKYTCGGNCGRLLDCTQHSCDQLCHVGPCDTCPLQPDRVTHCPCGKTTLVNVLCAKLRRLCTDPIPTCQLMCSKPLSCGSAGKLALQPVLIFFCLQLLTLSYNNNNNNK